MYAVRVVTGGILQPVVVLGVSGGQYQQATIPSLTVCVCRQFIDCSRPSRRLTTSPIVLRSYGHTENTRTIRSVNFRSGHCFGSGVPVEDWISSIGTIKWQKLD